jgi:hypothetical protein
MPTKRSAKDRAAEQDDYRAYTFRAYTCRIGLHPV